MPKTKKINLATNEKEPHKNVQFLFLLTLKTVIEMSNLFPFYS